MQQLRKHSLEDSFIVHKYNQTDLQLSPQYIHISYTMEITQIDYDVLQIINKVVYPTLWEKLNFAPKY